MIKPPNHNALNQSGFTLVELIVTIAIAAIVMAIAIPNFQTLIKNGRQTAALQEFQKTVQIARDEAIARNTNIIMCATTTGTECSNSNSWETGYLVAVASPFSVISRHSPATGTLTIRATADTNSMTFTDSGLLRDTDSFRICDDRGSTQSKGLVTSAGGIRNSTSTDNIGNCP